LGRLERDVRGRDQSKGRGWLTRWKCEFGVFEVKVYDFGEGMDLCDFELANEL
jgi:hypothetical protein